MKEFLEIVLRASMRRLTLDNLTSENMLKILEENGVIKNSEITLKDLISRIENAEKNIRNATWTK